MRPGRSTGGLLLLQMAGSVIANFVLLEPVFADPPGYLVSAVDHPLRIGLAAILGLVTGGLSIGVAVQVWPVFRPRAEGAALWFLALTLVGMSGVALESASLMSLLSLSQAHAAAGGSSEATFQALRGVVASARNWAHYTQLMLAGASLVVFYATLFRLRLVPRALAGFGVAAACSQIAGVARPLLGHPVEFLLLAPLGLCHLTLAIWLLVKGFRLPPAQPGGVLAQQPGRGGVEPLDPDRPPRERPA